MLMTEIRHQLVDIPEATEANLALADEAESLLGYSGFKKAVSVAVETDTCILARSLKKLDIEVLNSDDVKRYQTAMMKEAARVTFERWINDPTMTDGYASESWGEIEIKRYDKPIPEFVLNKAVQIKKAFPEVEFFVCGLGVHPDPFLVAKRRETKHYDWGDYKSDAESYYIEVWAEPKFEASL